MPSSRAAAAKLPVRAMTSIIDSASGVTQIAQRIGEVAKAAGEAVQISDEVQASAAGLTKIANGLKTATEEFLSQLRAA